MAVKTDAIEAFLRRIRWRVGAQVALRVLALGGAATALGVALTSWLLGPLPPAALAIGSVCVVAVAGLGTALHQGRRIRSIQGRSVASLLARHSEDLASSALSALELNEGSPGASDELVRAHRMRVEAALKAIEPKTLAPLGAQLSPHVVGALLAVAVICALALKSPRGRAGAYALIHAFDSEARGARRADIVQETRAELRFPAHRHRATLHVDNADALELPQGTTVTLRVRFRVEPSRAALRLNGELGGEEVRLTPDAATGARWYTAEFVARRSGPLEIVLCLNSLRVLFTAHGCWDIV